mgnify:CR=1 FL=1
MKLTTNFSLSEFETGGKIPEDLMRNVKMLAANLQTIRDEIGKPIRIHSGYRTPANNTGVKRSQHLLAKAADLRVSGMKATELHKVVLRLIRDGRISKGGVGLYPGGSSRRAIGFVHYDVRGFNARWQAKK